MVDKRGVELQTAISRAPYRTLVWGERPKTQTARIIALAWRDLRHQRRDDEQLLALIEKTDTYPGSTKVQDRETIRKRLSERRPRGVIVRLGRQTIHASAQVVRARRKAALWVELTPGAIAKELPELEEIAQLRSQGLERWSTFLRRYGLPDRNSDFIALSYWNVPDQYHPGLNSEFHRIPLWWLQQVAQQAAALLACESAALGDAGALRKEIVPLEDRWKESTPERLWRDYAETFVVTDHAWGIPDLDILPRTTVGDDVLIAFARTVISYALEDALGRVKGAARPGTRPIPEDWELRAEGWWPLVVLQEFVYRSRYAEVRMCAAEGCNHRLTPRRRKFCSRRCYLREKQRRHRQKTLDRLEEESDESSGEPPSRERKQSGG